MGIVFFFKAQLWVLQRKIMIINALDKDSITWTVPSFPVLDITFRRGVALIRGNNQHVLFNAEDAVLLVAHERIICTKWCQITIEDINYLVVWKFEKLSAIRNEPTVANQGQAIAGDDNTKHTLPFKVLGVSYKNRQIHLKCASEKLKTNEEVQIMIKPEPDNDHDKNAIAVLLNYGTGWKTVGYIASELTRYLHPSIERNSLTVTIAHIRFRVTYMLAGYYLTINITRKGQWCSQVIIASKTVK